MTQPTIQYRFIDGKLVGTSRKEDFNGHAYNGVDYYNLLTRLNNVIYEVAGKDLVVVELTNLPMWNMLIFMIGYI
jgi:hypothetical protein